MAHGLGKEAYAAYMDAADAKSVERVVFEAVASRPSGFMFNNVAAAWSRHEFLDRSMEVRQDSINVSLSAS